MGCFQVRYDSRVVIYERKLFIRLATENNHLLCKGKYHCMTDLLFEWFGFNQTSKYVVNSTKSNQPNPSK